MDPSSQDFNRLTESVPVAIESNPAQKQKRVGGTIHTTEGLAYYYIQWSTFLRHYTETDVGNSLMKKFWPFNFQLVKLNQMFAAYGLTKESVDQDLKNAYYNALYKMYNLPVPIREDGKIELSFNNARLAMFLQKTNMLKGTDAFLANEKYALSASEKDVVSRRILEAMDYINRTSPELHMSVNQLISCIAVYKSMSSDTIGGSTGSLPGLIYMNANPSESDWPVAFYAELIVHEYIHNVLFLQEFVLGAYRNREVLSQTKVVSAMRRIPRNYDHSFHASYVVAGLVAFHIEAGLTKRAEKLAGPLRSSVDGLLDANRVHGVLTERGQAMLHNVNQFVTLENRKE